MAGIPSIGDILMLSQLAWRIGRAFTAGRQGAPREFIEVESEVNGLTKALKLLAETLFADADDCILSRADKETQYGVATILLSCKQTLHDLDSLLDQYQVIRKHRTSAGFTIERSWSDMVFCNYKTMMWTAEGGNIQALRNMLQMHTSTISLTMQALQSKSLARLERTVAPMAEKIDDIHRRLTGDLNEKIDEVHRMVSDIAGKSPATGPKDIPELRGNRQNSSYSLIDLNPSPRQSPLIEPLAPAVRSPSAPISPTSPIPQTPELYRSNRSSPVSTARSSGWSFGPFDEKSESYRRASASRSPPMERKSSKRPSDAFKNLPALAGTPEMEEKQVEEVGKEAGPMSALGMPFLPPPALPPYPGSSAASTRAYSLVPSNAPEPVVLSRSITSASQQSAFERSVFRNTAILCELHGSLVEYTQPVEDEMRPWDMEMVEAAKDCRVCVVRKRETLPNNAIRLTTSIWVFSEDRGIRMQQKFSDGDEVIPYASYFSPEKISVTIPTSLKFHDITYGAPMLKNVKTTWVNYVFHDATSANLFQNEIMGRTLLRSFKTEKTLRIHEGLSGVLAYQEQMCGMENLRLWEDETSAGVIAMIHFSAQFRIGYLAFYLNSSTTPVRVKDEGGKEVKIKGLRIPLDVPNRRGSRKASEPKKEGEQRRGSEAKKFVTGARIEFATEGEKVIFINKVRDIQKTMIALPEL